jgi:hypothetical protein
MMKMMMIIMMMIIISPIREEISTDSLKFHVGPPCPTLIRPAGRRPVAIFFPLGYPFPYGPDNNDDDDDDDNDDDDGDDD